MPVHSNRRSWSLFPLFLLAAALTSSCAATRPEELARSLAPRVPQERTREVQLAAYLAGPDERRALRSADDVLEWLENFWKERDPTPATPENELLQVYAQRAAYMEKRFPDTPFGEWPQVWSHFLRYGLPDSRGPDFVPWPRPDEEGRRRTPPSIASGFTWERLRYGSPVPYTFILDQGIMQRPPFDSPPPAPPSLEGVWKTLENPTTPASEKQQALTLLSWYELTEVAERLIGIPNDRFEDIADHFEEACYRLTRRISYRLDQPDIRRLAALIAAGGGGVQVLRRASAARYDAAALSGDLLMLSEHRLQLPRTPHRGPHPRLWVDPEGFLDDLARRFHSSNRITGWDWRGDLHLALGPPGYLDLRNRTAYYQWGTPEVLGLGDSMLGWIEVTRIRDPLREFIATASMDIRERRNRAGAATATLSEALTAHSTGEGEQITETFLEQLHVLAPPAIYRVGAPQAASYIPITVDIVAFPARGDSVEIQATFGIPAESVRIRQEGERFHTNLRTNIILVDHGLNVVHAQSRQGGYSIEGGGEVSGRFFLDTFRFITIPGSYIVYLSAEDPESGISGGVLVSTDLVSMATNRLQVSPILLATDIRPAVGTGKFVRGDELILPAPFRQFLYSQDLYFYFEVENLTTSDIGDHVWKEAFFIIPDNPGEGIVAVAPEQERTSLSPSLSRSMQIDLSSLGETYEGFVFVVVLITDMVSGNQAVGATIFSLRSPPQGGRGLEP